MPIRPIDHLQTPSGLRYAHYRLQRPSRFHRPSLPLNIILCTPSSASSNEVVLEVSKPIGAFGIHSIFKEVTHGRTVEIFTSYAKWSDLARAIIRSLILER